MASDSMSPLQRVMLIVAASILFPSVILIGWLFREISIQKAESLEASSHQAADLIVLLADTRAEADLTALRVLSISRFFAARDFDGASTRAVDVLSLVPGWKAVVLSEAATGKVYFTAAADGVIMGGAEAFSNADAASESGFGGVQRDGAWCPCVRLQVVVREQPDLLLTAIVDPAVYQNLLMEELPGGAVAALVDQRGNFVARSLDFESKVGTPASQFVRDAVVRGGRGLYKGTTLEGLENYSAYAVSERTGWSSHVAMNHELLDGPRAMADGAVLVGALAAILIGAVLFTYVARDIAARRLEDRRMMEIQKADAVKEFMATVIHDFRNIAAAVQSGLNLIVRRTKEPHTEESAVMIGEVLERGTRLTNRLLNFVREDTGGVHPIEIRAFFKDVDYLLNRVAGHGVQLKITVPPAEVTLLANRDQLELALVNLVVNARDAMKASGEIDISVGVDGQHVRICVADTGPGIPPELRPKVFTRFFTTKPHGSGTGLGLSQVAEMVREANGQVSIEEASGGGAMFVLRLARLVGDEKTSETENLA